MADLITSARAKYNLNNMTTTSAEDTTIAALVTACSKAIKKFCGREFDSQQFDELYPGNGYTRSPAAAVPGHQRGPRGVRADDGAAHQEHVGVQSTRRSAVTSSGLSLTRVASGTSSTDTSVTWAGNATLSAVATAVNVARQRLDRRRRGFAPTTIALPPTFAPSSAFDAMNVDAELKIHVRELTSYDVDTERGILILGSALVRCAMCCRSGPAVATPGA